MRRAIVTAAAVGAVLVLAGGAPAGGAICPLPSGVTWHATRYKTVATRAHIPLGRRLGTGAVTSCRTTNPGGYAARPRDASVRRSVYAVDGLRTQVAVATSGARPALYVSSTRATAVERRVLNRLRGR